MLPAPNHRLMYIKSHHSLPTAACNQLLPSEQALLTLSFPCSFIKGCLVSFVFQDCFQSHQLPHAGFEHKAATYKRVQNNPWYHLSLMDSYRLFPAWESQGIATPSITWTICKREGVCVRSGWTLCTYDVFGTSLSKGRWKVSQPTLGHSSCADMHVLIKCIIKQQLLDHPLLPQGNYYWH